MSTEHSNTELAEDILEKSKCVRCGKPSKNGGPGGRCSSCLKKLATAKKTPGSAQRAQTKADDALRRQDGKNGTASKKSSGRGTRKSIVKQIQSAEKKTGQKLSPDRKDNSKGYAASNTRAVPEKLNRGRHKVDPKKLKAWKERVKKSDIELDDFMTLLVLKMKEQEKDLLLKSLSGFTVEEIADIIDYITGTEDLESTI
jgi:hypothetical protein